MRHFISFSICVYLLLSCNSSHKSQDYIWQINTVEDLWRHHPDRLRSLFTALDLTQERLAPIQVSLSNGDTIKAGRDLVGYYKDLDREWIITTLDHIEYEDAFTQAQALIVDSIIREGQLYRLPSNADGSWKWDYTGPNEDDEFGYSLNGHKYLPPLFYVARETEDSKYAKQFDHIIKDWILHHPFPEKEDSVHLVWDPQVNLDYRDIGEVEWRTLETGHRLGASWPQTFYGFQQSDAFTPASRLLMLSSLAMQSDFLQKNHKHGHNWTTMEMNGLALSGLSFPEFKNASTWATYAQNVMKNEINRQVYPDGLQSEISSKTQWVALHRFETLAKNFSTSGSDMSDEYMSRVEQMYDYLAYSMRPDGHQPLNNDSDRDNLKPRILKAAEKFDRPDWKYIATNGKLGSPPKSKISITFPWAGIHIMRNGWSRDADWTFFDAGPYGTGHQHRDMLHLSISAFGKDMLVDGGRYTHKDYFNFDPAFWRGYFRSSYSHNVILVDGNGQKEGPLRADNPLVENQDYIHTPIYDYAFGIFKDGFEKTDDDVIHSRSVMYLKGKYWIVLDQIKTDQPHNIEALWHYAPENAVSIDGMESVSKNENQANLRIIPVGNIPWDIKIIEGQEKPVIQGWYSSVFGEKVTNPTMVYKSKITNSCTFAWVMVPSKGKVPPVKAEMIEKNGAAHILISNPKDNDIRIIMPLDHDLSKIKVQL